MKNLTVAIATFNEESNLKDCLESVKNLASEIVIVDGSSKDKTIEIAKEYNSKILVTDNPKIFHINKQKALELSTNEWILQLDADERVSPKLSEEIIKVLNMTDQERAEYQQDLKGRKLFLRHQKLIEERDGAVGKRDGPIVAFFIPRLNYFLGRYLRYGGVYPDGVIRLIRKQYAHFPAIDVHEQIEVDGRVGWLESPLYHLDSPTFERYLIRNNRYTDLMAEELVKEGSTPIKSLNYLFIKPTQWFLLTYFRHKGFLDLWPGLVFSFYSALRFPISYVKYLDKKNEKK